MTDGWCRRFGPLAQALADSDAGLALAQALADSDAGLALAQALADSDAGLALAQALADRGHLIICAENED